MREGYVWLSSFRKDEQNSYRLDWVYPGVTTFRLETVKVMAYAHGWAVEEVPSYGERLSGVCPNDVHDWLRFRAIPLSAEMNELRIGEEELERRHEQVSSRVQAAWRKEMDKSKP